MKKIITFLLLTLLIGTFTLPANAMGLFYTKATYPITATGVKSTKPVSELKRGTGKTMNILWFVETGDAGIKEAAEDANIRRIHFIDIEEETIFFFFRKLTTTVYGE
ncbi:MAG: TRL-like family protein [Candidatus Gastranaerophilales bacterium]|nr:TRL-like family protein [Candidatus Gastranaerophilales bacterium]